MNAEIDPRRLPGLAGRPGGRARTDAPEYLAAADEWLTQINADHRAPPDRPTAAARVILYQIENELALTSPAQRATCSICMTRRAPTASPCRSSTTTRAATAIGCRRTRRCRARSHGPVDIYAFDGYPGGTCNVRCHARRTRTRRPDWGIYGPGGARGGAIASPDTPGFVAEFGGGWFDYWGTNGGYECTAHPRRARATSACSTAPTSPTASRSRVSTWPSAARPGAGCRRRWCSPPTTTARRSRGAPPAPQGGDDEAARPVHRGVEPLTQMDARRRRTRRPRAAIKVYHNVDSGHRRALYFAMHKPSNALTNDTFTFPLDTARRQLHRAAVGHAAHQRAGREDAARRLRPGAPAAGLFDVGAADASATQDDGDVALLYGRDGRGGRDRAALRLRARPSRCSTARSPAPSTPPSGDLRLNYTHGGLARVRITGGGRPPLLLLHRRRDDGAEILAAGDRGRSVLVRGPALVRNAERARRHAGADRRHAQADAELEIWAPAATAHGQLERRRRRQRRRAAAAACSPQRPLRGPERVTLPDLAAATWRYRRRVARGRADVRRLRLGRSPTRPRTNSTDEAAGRAAGADDGRLRLPPRRRLVSRPLHRRRRRQTR